MKFCWKKSLVNTWFTLKKLFDPISDGFLPLLSWIASSKRGFRLRLSSTRPISYGTQNLPFWPSYRAQLLWTTSPRPSITTIFFVVFWSLSIWSPPPFDWTVSEGKWSLFSTPLSLKEFSAQRCDKKKDLIGVTSLPIVGLAEESQDCQFRRRKSSRRDHSKGRNSQKMVHSFFLHFPIALALISIHV